MEVLEVSPDIVEIRPWDVVAVGERLPSVVGADLELGLIILSRRPPQQAVAPGLHNHSILP